MHADPLIETRLLEASARTRTLAVLVTLACAVWVFAWYWETTFSIVSIWERSETFAHGFVVVPIFGYLVWRDRANLAGLPIRPFWPALAGLALAGLAWVVGEAGSVLALEQFAIVAMIPLLMWAILGTAIVRELAFPIAFLFFAVPFGDFLVPTLIDWTAEFTIGALRLTGVPVFREGAHFQIPSGRWSVVEACSGIRYLIASMMVGCLYAYLTYRSLRRRLLFVGFSILVPIVANWLRAYMIVMIGHLSDNRLAVGVDHIIYGWIFFGVVMAIMFFVGSRWREDLGEQPAPARPVPAAPDVGWRPDARFIGTAVAALLVASMWKPVNAMLQSVNGAGGGQLAAVAEAAGWSAERKPISSWHPEFLNPTFQLHQTFLKDGRRVGLYVGYYRHQSQDSELVGWHNQLITSRNKRWLKAAGGERDVTLGGAPLRVRTAELAGDGMRLQAFQWYWIGGRVTSSDHVAKLYTVLDRLTGRGDDGAVVIVYTPMTDARDTQAAAALAGFVSDLAPQIEARLGATRGR
jgi:exosortase A